MLLRQDTSLFIEEFLPRIGESRVSESEEIFNSEGLSLNDFSLVYEISESWTRSDLLSFQDASNRSTVWDESRVSISASRSAVEDLLTREGYGRTVVSLKEISNWLEIDFGSSSLKALASEAFYDLCLAAIGYQFQGTDEQHIESLNYASAPKLHSKFHVHLVSERPAYTGHHLHKAQTDKNGQTISRELNYETWSSVRKRSITASDATKLLKKNGEPSVQRQTVLGSKAPGYFSEHFSSYDLGIEREPVLAKWVTQAFPKEQFSANDLIYEAKDPRHVATPDLVGKSSVCEIKVSIKPLDKILSKYSDQIQWQMYVLDLGKSLFVVENRESQNIETLWVHRDQKRIDDLKIAANEVLAKMVASKPLSSLPAVGGKFLTPDKLGESEDRANLETYEFAALFKSRRYEQTYKLLDRSNRKLTITLYSQGLTISQISEKISKPQNDVAATLGLTVLNSRGNLLDGSPIVWRKPWSLEEKIQVDSLYRTGKGIRDISSHLGRDRLSVIKLILDTFVPPVPKKALKKYKIES